MVDEQDTDAKYEVGKTVNFATIFDREGYTCDDPDKLNVTFTTGIQNISVNYTSNDDLIDGLSTENIMTMNNSKNEIQTELDSKGIEYKQSENKQALIDKLNN